MFNHFLYGSVVLLEENAAPETLAESCAAMASLEMNTVVIWPPVFYRNGKADVRIQRSFLKAAAEYGLGVIVELTGQVSNLEYLPDWEWRREFAVENSDGTPALMQNGLGELNYNHPEVKSRIKRFLEFVVGELKDEPALCGWDIWNETHFKSFDAYTLHLFREWLEKKYGQIENLNGIWKKSYTDFSQIRLDPVTWASIVPDTDWEEFRVEHLAEIAAEWAEVVRKVDPVHPVTADNVMSNAVWSEFDRGTDDWELAKTVDCFGISFYPKTGGRLLKENSPSLRTFTFAGAASAGNGQFMIAEMQSHCYSELFTCERVMSEELIDWNFEALFQGACGSVYWKWEPFRTGFQLGGRGLVLADGSFSRRADAAREFGRFLKQYPDASHLTPLKTAAVLYDRRTNFTVKAMNNRIRHIIGDDQPARSRLGVAELCFQRNLPLTVVTPELFLKQEELSFSILFLPYQVVMDQELANGVERFLRNGGTVVASAPFGTVSPDGRLFEALPGGPLHHLTGIRLTDSREDSYHGIPMDLHVLEIIDSEVVMKTDGGFPLLLLRREGKGRLFFAAADVWNMELIGNEIFDYILKSDGRRAVPLQADCHVEYASGEEFDYLWVPNYENAEFCRIEMSREAEVIFGKGKMERSADGLTLQHARQMVLRLRKEIGE